MESLKKAAQEYVKAIESVREARKRLAEVIIKYLIATDDLTKCTELAISQNLGLPRSVVRSILTELSEHVLEVREFGRAKVYMFSKVGIGAALDYMGLQFTREEINELLRAREVKGAHRFRGIYTPLVAMKGDDGKPVCRFRGYAADLCLDTLVKRFLYLLLEEIEVKVETVTKKLKAAFGERGLKELELLAPESSAFQKLIEPVSKQLFLHEWLIRGIADQLAEMPPDEIRRAIVKEFETALKRVITMLKRFGSMLERMGYEGLHKYFKGRKPIAYRLSGIEAKPDYRFHDEYVWATTLALREGCVMAEKLGVNPELIKEARLLADILDIALEKKYRGAEAEGLSLMEWGIRQLSK